MHPPMTRRARRIAGMRWLSTNTTVAPAIGPKMPDARPKFHGSRSNGEKPCAETDRPAGPRAGSPSVGDRLQGDAFAFDLMRRDSCHVAQLLRQNSGDVVRRQDAQKMV